MKPLNVGPKVGGKGSPDPPWSTALVIAMTSTAGKRTLRTVFSSHYHSNKINHTFVTMVNRFYAVLKDYKQPLFEKRRRELALMNN